MTVEFGNKPSASVSKEVLIRHGQSLLWLIETFPIVEFNEVVDSNNPEETQLYSRLWAAYLESQP